MISTIYSRSFRFCLALFSQAILLLCALSCHAETVTLAPGLEINLPSALSLQLEQQDQREFSTLVGEVNGTQSYFMAATLINIWERDPVLWKRLESSIRQQSSASEPLLRMEDTLTASPHGTVSYKIYEYESEQQKHLQAYFLLKGERSLYWISLTTVPDTDISTVLPLAQALISRMRFVN